MTEGASLLNDPIALIRHPGNF